MSVSPTFMPRSEQLLSSRSAIKAQAVHHAEATISELFCKHTLTPLEKREVRMSLRSAHDADVGIEVLDYGEAVRIQVDSGLEDFHLVQIPLVGKATMSVGDSLVQSSRSVATVPPIDQPFTMRWDAGTPTMILYVSKSKLQAVARQMYGLEDAECMQLALQMQMNTPEGVAFLRSLLEWHNVLEDAGPNADYLRKLSSEMLLARMLSALENSATRSLETPGGAANSIKSDALAKRFMAAIEEGVSYGVGVLELADQLSVPVRTLQEHVKTAFGSTPSSMLREARLQHAHRLLCDANPSKATVTAIAEECGFGHLGRFAQEYRARFGETPAQTLRR